MKLESIALHHGYESEGTTKSATTPIYQTSSFTFDNTQHGADNKAWKNIFNTHRYFFVN